MSIREELNNRLSEVYDDDVEITTSKKGEAQKAWPSVLYRGVPIFKPYMDSKFNNAMLKGIEAEIGDNFTSAQEVYLGYSKKTDKFLTGWDAWDTEGIVAAFAELKFYNGQFKIIKYVEVDNWGEGFYGKNFYKKLEKEYKIDTQLRLD